MLVDEARVAELGRIKLVRVRMELDPRRDQALPPLGQQVVERFVTNTVSHEGFLRRCDAARTRRAFGQAALEDL